MFTRGMAVANSPPPESFILTLTRPESPMVSVKTTSAGSRVRFTSEVAVCL